MSKERELLGKWYIGDLLPEEYMKLMKETKELLAQPEQEPVAWMYEDPILIKVNKIDGDLKAMNDRLGEKK